MGTGPGEGMQIIDRHRGGCKRQSVDLPLGPGPGVLTPNVPRAVGVTPCLGTVVWRSCVRRPSWALR